MRFKTITAALSAAILLAGCAHTGIQLRSTNSPSIPASIPPPGTTSYSSAAFQAEVSPGAYIGLLLFSHFLAGFQDDYRDWRHTPIGRKPPELAEDRNVVDMDCSRPIDLPSANLRCK